MEGYFRGSFHESAGAARHTTTRVGNHERSHAKDQWERALRPHLPARARGGGLPAVGPLALLMWFYSSPLVVALSPAAETGAGAGRVGSSGLLDRVLALGPIEHKRPRHPRRPKDEAAMFAVHVRRGDPKNDGSQAGEVERLAAQRLARDDGAEIEVGDGLNIVRAHFVYENDLTDPLEPEEVERWLGGTPNL